MTARKRNGGLDAAKGLACIAVVFMHCEFPGMLGTMAQCLARWSVPLFFAVSGYFFRRETAEECLRKAKRIARITAWAVLFYVCVGIVLHLLKGDPAAYARSEFTLFNLLSFIVFNSPVFVNGHLWFLFALIYVYLAVAVLIRFDLLRYEKSVGAILLVCHFLLAYGFFLMGKSLPGGAYRNFLFEGLPFFFMGHLFAKADRRISAGTGALLIAFGLGLSVAERLWLGRDFSVHLGSVAVLAGLLTLAEKIPDGALRILRTVGRKYSMNIYILHPAVYLLTDCILEQSGGVPALWLWIRPIYTLAVAFGLSALLDLVKRTEKER